jgi:diguanylate cyclase (GGDEF)-like protein
MKLFYKLFLPISLTVVLSVLIISTIFLKIENKNQENLSYKNLEHSINVIENNFDLLFNSYSALAKAAANDRKVKEFLEDYDLTDTVRVEIILEHLVNTMNASELINNVLLVPKDGLMNLNARGGNQLVADDITNNPYFIALSGDTSLDFHLGRTLAGPQNGKPIIAIAASTKSDQGFIGCVAIPINLYAFINEVIYPSLSDPTTHILMINQDGQVFAGEEEAYIYNDNYSLPNLDQELFTLIIENKNGQLMQDFMGQSSIISYAYYEPMDAYILAFQDTSSLHLSQQNNIIRGLIITLVILLLSGIVLFLNTQKQVQPIYQLIDYSSQLSKGNFSSNIDCNIIKRRDEIGTLAKAYYTMSESLHKTFTQLEKVNHELNDKNILLTASQQELKDKLRKINLKTHYIKFLAFHDSLTKLPNRREFNNKLQQALMHSENGAILLLDLDNFKSINDTNGHVFGDQILVKVANKLQKLANKNVFISRFGGDEFIVLVRKANALSSFIQQVDAIFAHPFITDNISIEITYSMGIARFPHDGHEAEQLIMCADIAMYTVKSKGKNNQCYFDLKMKEHLIYRTEIEKALKDAIANEGFKILYQPQVSLTSGEIIAYEALLRLKNKAYSPGEFIPVAEESGYVNAIGRFVTKEVITQIASWQKDSLKVKPVSINFSPKQLYDKDYLKLLNHWLDAYQVSPSMIEIEVTESIFVENIKATTNYLNELRNMGIKISIDDFGTGYSSINYLTFMPISKLKLDSSLSKKFLSDQSNSVIKSIISLAHSLSLEVVAEGIEDQASMYQLKALNCDIIQGYYFSKPLDVSEIQNNIDTHYEIF